MRALSIFLLLISCSQALAIELDGRTDFGSVSSLNSSISSRVTEILVGVGQRVSQGDTLLIMDDTTLQADLDHAQARVDALSPTLEKMQTELDKAQELYDRNSLAQVELEVAEQNHAIAAAKLAAAEARLAKARYLLSQTRLLTPIDGIVLSIGASRGQFVNTLVSDPVLVTVADDRIMRVVTMLPVEHWKKNLVGKSASVRFREQNFSGRVVAVDSRITTGENRHPAVIVHLEFAADGRVPANSEVEVTIDLD